MRVILLCLIFLINASLVAQEWSFNAKKLAPIVQSGGQFGSSVAINRSIALVTQSLDSYRGLDTIRKFFHHGSVSIFELEGDSSWIFRQEIEADSTHDLHFFGNTLEIVDDIIIVGVRNHRINYLALNEIRDAGAVFVFNRSNSGEWTQSQMLLHYNYGPARQFGRHIASHGRNVLISSHDNFRTGEQDVIDLYELNEDDTLVHIQTIELEIDSTDRFQIFDIDLTANRAFVSGQFDLGLDRPAVVDIYKLNEDSLFEFESRIESPSERRVYLDSINNLEATDFFGYDIEATEDYLIISAPFEARTGVRKGKVYYYRKGSKDNWWLAQSIEADEPQTNAFFGLKIVAKDDELMVGEPRRLLLTENGDSIIGGGRVYYYKLNRYKEWMNEQSFEYRDPFERNWFGQVMDFHGEHLVLGSFLDYRDVMEKDSITDAGAAYFYRNPVEVCPQDVELLVYPNPNNGVFEICTSDSSGIIDLEMYNALGQPVKLAYQRINGCIVEVRLKGIYSSGTYFLHHINREGRRVAKIQIQKHRKL